MIAYPYWINETLAIIPRPHGDNSLDDEMVALKEAGIDVVASMLQPVEAFELGLEEEAASAKRAGLEFIQHPVPDRNVPIDLQAFHNFLTLLEIHLLRGRRIGVHCRACIGRSSVTVASLLIRSGISPESAWKQIEEARFCPVPDTKEQQDWVNHNIQAKS